MGTFDRGETEIHSSILEGGLGFHINPRLTLSIFLRLYLQTYDGDEDLSNYDRNGDEFDYRTEEDRTSGIGLSLAYYFHKREKSNLGLLFSYIRESTEGSIFYDYVNAGLNYEADYEERTSRIGIALVFSFL